MFHPGFWEIACLNEYLKYELSLGIAIPILLKCIETWTSEYITGKINGIIFTVSVFFFKSQNTNFSNFGSQIFFLRKWIIAIF